MKIEKLLNRKVVSASKDPDGCHFSIEFEDGVQKFFVEGDCCSHSWIEHLEIPNDINGAILLAVDETTISDQDTSDCERLQVYETRFRTNRGDIVLEYRNSSNGYYGGFIMMID